MKIQGKTDFIAAIRDQEINTPYVIIKPNWINDHEGEFTEAEVLEWLLESLPDKKKIVIESYTPWRGLIYQPKNQKDDLLVDLEGGKKYRDFYRVMDENFLQKTRIAEILKKYETEYINITEMVWGDRCVSQNQVIKDIEGKGYSFTFPAFTGYIPLSLYQIRKQSTLISLGKIKRQLFYPKVGFGGSIKNLFGLIPDPSRGKYHPGNDFIGLDKAMTDIFFLYTQLFPNNCWIAEGIFTIPKEPYTQVRTIERNQNLLFLGRNPIKVDLEACQVFSLEPNNSEYFRSIITITMEMGLFI
jgi:hypothetical protein